VGVESCLFIGSEVAARLLGMPADLMTYDLTVLKYVQIYSQLRCTLWTHAVACCAVACCAVQVLGAKRKNLAGYSSSTVQPHQGFIYGCALIQATPPGAVYCHIVMQDLDELLHFADAFIVPRLCYIWFC
jgi:hypothetical protein